MEPLRAAVIGARRVRQGTGEYVARELDRLGCQVVAIVGTRPESVEEARAGLRERHGLDCRGYLSLEALLDAEPSLDVVAVCSPPGAHAPQVQLALARGCHVFAEKPLFWSDGMQEPTAALLVQRRVELICDLARRRGLHLALNTQWPFTLDGFRELHPDALEGPLRSLRMWLAPMTTGVEAVVDSGSHLLSMLYALAGQGQLEDIQVSAEDPQRTRQLLRARYLHEQGVADVELKLSQCPQPPRPAGYAINGKAVDRHVEMPAYRLSFRADGREAPLKDPLALSVEHFVRSVRTPTPLDRASIVAGMVQLQELVAAASRP